MFDMTTRKGIRIRYKFEIFRKHKTFRYAPSGSPLRPASDMGASCDGGRSGSRRQAGTPAIGWSRALVTPPRLWLVNQPTVSRISTHCYSRELHQPNVTIAPHRHPAEALCINTPILQIWSITSRLRVLLFVSPQFYKPVIISPQRSIRMYEDQFLSQRARSFPLGHGIMSSGHHQTFPFTGFPVSHDPLGLTGKIIFLFFGFLQSIF